MKRLILVVAVYVALMLLAVSGVSAGDNGGDGAGTLDPPITVNAGWFKTTDSPPAFVWFFSNPSGPFTFSSPTPVILYVTDDFCRGDQFEIFDWGSSIGVTSEVALGSCSEVGPDAAYADPTYSSGAFPLDAGSHSIAIVAIVNPFNVGRGYLKVDSVIGEIPVDIDIKPGSDPNCFNNDGHGVIPVAILTTDAFDAATVDPFSVSLDGLGERVKGKSGNEGSLEDVDYDGDLDLVLHIVDQDGVFEPGSSTATLTGLTYGGIPIVGQDTICVVPD